MAKKKTGGRGSTKGSKPEKTVLLRLGGMSLQKKRISLGGVKLAADAMNAREAEDLLIDATLDVTLYPPGDVPGQESLPGMDEDVKPIKFTATTGAMTKGAESITFGLSVDRKAFSMDSMGRFCFCEVKAKLKRTGKSSDVANDGDGEDDPAE